MGFDLAAVASLFAVGLIFFGHFEERTPKWRRLLKLAGMLAITALISATAGRVGAWAFVAAAMSAGLAAHFVILRRHGIDPWSAEPRDKYYALRGWTVPK